MPHRPLIAVFRAAKMRLVLLLGGALCLPLNASAYSGYGNENPFVEAMLRMMEVFGIIDRGRLPLGVPYLPSYGQGAMPGIGGLSGLGGMPGLGGYPMPGMTPSLGALGGYPALGGLTGLSPLTGYGGLVQGLPATGAWPGGLPGLGGMTPYPGAQGWTTPGPAYRQQVQQLDGIWELDKGGFVILRGNAARLYLARDRYQDFTIGYDDQWLWWTPQSGGTASRYQYRRQDGRMILRDDDGNYLLLRRRR